jgi:hypothetical protein
LISPQFVKPFVKTNKNDANDAMAIVEAASRPSMNFVPIKQVEQQDLFSLSLVCYNFARHLMGPLWKMVEQREEITSNEI